MADIGDDFDASKSNATLLLWSHILQKGLQAGGILGVAVAVPVAVYRAKSISLPLATAAIGRTALGITAVTAALGIAKFTQMDQAGIEDRVYRLHFNQGQNRTDQFAQDGQELVLASAWPLLSPNKVGAALGLAAAATAARRPISLFGSVAAGAGIGALAHVATMPKPQNAGPNKMLHELKN